MQLPSVKDLKVFGKTILLRTDYDVPLRLASARSGQALRPSLGQAFQIADATRIEKSLPTINYLLEKKAKIIIISHLGRPEGKAVTKLSLKPVAEYLNKLLPEAENCQLHENLRFDAGEENPSTNEGKDFTKHLAGMADYYVNDAFAVSHRGHASIVGLPQFLPSAFGLNFLKEIEVLDKVRQSPRRPVTVILGGAKEDKLEEARRLTDWADYILIGGRLPLLIANYPIDKLLIKKVVVAELNSERKDITLESEKSFREIIGKAGTVIWAGPMGVWEEKQFERGTREIAGAIAESEAFSVVGGGDTEAALTKFGLEGKMSFISSGGGAMFEFLATGTLAGIEAIQKNPKSEFLNPKQCPKSK